MNIMCFEIKKSVLRARAIVIDESPEKARILLSRIDTSGDLWKNSKEVWNYPLKEYKGIPVVLEANV